MCVCVSEHLIVGRTIDVQAGSRTFQSVLFMIALFRNFEMPSTSHEMVVSL